MANSEVLYKKALAGEALGFDGALQLYRRAPLEELMAVAHAIRKQHHGEDIVTWQIDRNVNTTNVCISGCRFCTFHCRADDPDRAYITSLDEYRHKIRQMQALGGEQLLLQGGLHPRLGIEWYQELFTTLKREFPTVKLHALGPPEVAHLARMAGLEYREVLERLMRAGLDSLPGAGAEILDNELRHRLSPGKCSADVWMEVMRQAHRLGLHTSATMMYGHIEEAEHRILHLLKLRDLQAIRPAGTPGFVAFIPWPYQGPPIEMGNGKWKIENKGGELSEFLRMIAISRIVLHNIPSIQASWLTVGLSAGQMALHGGANDMGSIMIEENVVSSSTGRTETVLDAERMQEAIRAAGFQPRLRNQRYELL